MKLVPHLTHLIEIEMLKAYAQQALKTEIIGLATGLIMLMYFWHENNQHYLSFWLVVLVSGPFIHHFVIYQFHKNKITPEQTLQRLQLFWFGSGCLWGTFFLVCHDENNAVNIAILTGLAAGMLAGAAPGASMLRHVYVFFSVPLCFLYSFTMFTTAVIDLNIMGLLGFIMLGLMLMLSHQLHTEFRQSIALRFENIELLNVLKKTNADKTRFLAAASHDLRQPHQALGLFLESLDYLEKEPKKKDIIYKTKQAFYAMSDLLDQLLDISKLDSGTIKPNMQPIVLQPLLHQITMGYLGQVEQRGLELRLRPTDAVVYVDAVMLHRMLSNLLSNAMRYTTKGGILIGVRHCAQGWRVMVCDTGQGIPIEKQELIFQEFTQLENANQDREKGLGLGLAIVRRLALMMDIEISLQSAEGKGSCFSMTLQEADTPQKMVIPVMPDVDVAYFLSLIVVVVDDDENARDGLVTLLTVWGCQVHAFASAAACRASLSTKGWMPDALIVDYQLQGEQTGVDVVYYIHKMCKKSVPTLMITGDITSHRIKDTQDSAFPILHKPVAPDKLRAFLRVL